MPKRCSTPAWRARMPPNSVGRSTRCRSAARPSRCPQATRRRAPSLCGAAPSAAWRRCGSRKSGRSRRKRRVSTSARSLTQCRCRSGCATARFRWSGATKASWPRRARRTCRARRKARVRWTGPNAILRRRRATRARSTRRGASRWWRGNAARWSSPRRRSTAPAWWAARSTSPMSRRPRRSCSSTSTPTPTRWTSSRPRSLFSAATSG